MADAERAQIEAEIKVQGEVVRKLKSEKAPKEKVREQTFRRPLRRIRSIVRQCT